MTSPKIQLARIVSRPLQENTYVAWLGECSQCLVFDPGLEPNLILKLLRDRRLDVAMILNTHGHGDHIGGNAALKDAFPAAPIVIGELDAPMLTDPPLNMSGMAGFRVTSPPADRTVRDGDVIEAAGFKLEVRHIPGHSPGHVVFVLHDNSPAIVFGGDVLFAGSVGRTDLPGGSFELLSRGIREKLFTLPGDTVVLPGHGAETTVEHERRTNPIVGEFARVNIRRKGY
jgi:glyoxylase-like metal-dependent hydrolase (beta-lactamase superfamily II)